MNDVKCYEKDGIRVTPFYEKDDIRVTPFYEMDDIRVTPFYEKDDTKSISGFPNKKNDFFDIRVTPFYEKDDIRVTPFYEKDDILFHKEENLFSILSIINRKKEIVYKLNKNYKDISILKKPYYDSISIYINDYLYIENLNSSISIFEPMKYQEFEKTKCYYNIFNGNEIVKYNLNDFYLIKWEKDNCIMLRNGLEIIEKENTKPIFQKYNIFEGNKILIEHTSFDITIPEITELIVKFYNLSYIYKLIITKNLHYHNLETYITSLDCKLINKVYDIYNEDYDCYQLKIEDNLGKMWNIFAMFNECIYEKNWSNFSIYRNV